MLKESYSRPGNFPGIRGNCEHCQTLRARTDRQSNERRFRGRVFHQGIMFHLFTIESHFETRPFPCKEGDSATEESQGGDQDLSDTFTWSQGMFLTEQAGENLN